MLIRTRNLYGNYSDVEKNYDDNVVTLVMQGFGVAEVEL
jgi:hypothetical protein